jgi:hypothetical protein
VRGIEMESGRVCVCEEKEREGEGGSKVGEEEREKT